MWHVFLLPPLLQQVVAVATTFGTFEATRELWEANSYFGLDEEEAMPGGAKSPVASRTPRRLCSA